MNSKVPGIVQLFRRCWRRLLAIELLALTLGFLVVTPVTAVLLRFFAARSGSSVVTDEDILFFLLSPAGAVALLFIGIFTFWIVFAKQAATLTLGFGIAEHGTITLKHTLRFVVARSVALFRLASVLLFRVLVLAAPFLLAAGITYLALLTRFDINYYLAVRPTAFWVAAVLLGLIFAGLATVIAVKLFHWIFALPLVLFERRGARAAISGSIALMRGRRLEVARWLLTWVIVVAATATLVTTLIAVTGRFLVPSSSESLALVALAVGAVLLFSGAANFIVSFLAAALLSLIVVRLYVVLGGTGQVTTAVADEVPPERMPRRRNARRIIFGGSTLAIASIVVIAVSVVRSIPMTDTTQITAHRGSSEVAPENTLAAMEQAIVDGADWVEIDVQEIADGTVIVFHDGDLKRLGGVPLRTVESTYDDLSQIDIGTWFSPRFADQRIPTLEQVLELCKDRVRVNIELKYYGTGGDLEQKVIDIVERYGMESHVVLMSLKRSGILEAKAMRPDWKMGFLTAVALGDLTKIDVDFLAVSTSLATRSLIWSAHRSGKEVHVWTVNDPVQMWALITRGADNLITDVPAVGRTVMTERSTMTAVERLLVEFGSWSGLIPSSAEVVDESDA